MAEIIGEYEQLLLDRPLDNWEYHERDRRCTSGSYCEFCGEVIGDAPHYFEVHCGCLHTYCVPEYLLTEG